LTKLASKLIPVLREGVEVVKMICFRRLSSSLAARFPLQDVKFRSMLTGAVINDIFGTPNQQEPFASFTAENRALIQAEIKGLAANFAEMRIPLTDALRMQVLCDQMDKIAGGQNLVLAKEAGLLLAERDLPLPHNFMEMVRRLGKGFGLIIPPLPPEAATAVPRR
jgi:hypothetical protein